MDVFNYPRNYDADMTKKCSMKPSLAKWRDWYYLALYKDRSAIPVKPRKQCEILRKMLAILVSFGSKRYGSQNLNNKPKRLCTLLSRLTGQPIATIASSGDKVKKVGFVDPKLGGNRS